MSNLLTDKQLRKEIVKSLNEFRWELQKPNALINADALVVCQGAFADQLLALFTAREQAVAGCAGVCRSS